MDSQSKDNNQASIDRRSFLTASAAGAAGLAATGLGVNAAAESKPAAEKLRTNSSSGIRTAIVTDTQLNMGPYIAKEFAKRNYNLVIADVQEGLPQELRRLGATDVLVVPGLEQEGPNNESKPGSIQKVVDAALQKYGGYDSVFIRTAVHATGDILTETSDGLHASYEQNCLAVMLALQAVLPPLVEGGGGQVVVQTSATGEKPHPGAMAYSVMRAAANMMVRCAALKVAPDNVCVNAVGTNFMNYPGFKHTVGADKDPKIMEAMLDMIPVGRLGETAEAAHFSMAMLDGYNMYTTGNFYPVAGGFNNTGMPL